nr:MAG TPA: hypothetical protein [Caudoviricetes sp.]
MPLERILMNKLNILSFTNKSSYMSHIMHCKKV